jgi:hypothetical protein
MLLEHRPRAIPARDIPLEVREDDIQPSITRELWVEDALRSDVWLHFSS